MGLARASPHMWKPKEALSPATPQRDAHQRPCYAPSSRWRTPTEPIISVPTAVFCLKPPTNRSCWQRCQVQLKFVKIVFFDKKAQKVSRQAVLTWERVVCHSSPPTARSFWVEVDVLHGLLMKGSFTRKNVLLVSVGRFVLAKILPVKSFSQKVP